MSCEDLVRGLPCLLAAPPPADVLGDGPVRSDDAFGLLRGDGLAVGVADHVGHAAGHHGPGTFGEVGGDDTQRAEVVFAASDHLGVVDAGELGVVFAGGVGGADQGGAQQPVAGFADGLAFAVGFPGLGRFGDQAGEGPDRLPRRNRDGSPMQATRAGPPTSVRPGSERAKAPVSTQR